MRKYWSLSLAAVLVWGLPASAGEEPPGTHIVISLAGEAYDGPPAFELRAGGDTIATGVLTKAIDTETEGRLFSNPAPLNFIQKFEYDVPRDEFLQKDSITVSLINDKFKEDGSGFDRNLFVNYVEVNGLRFRARDLVLFTHGKETHIDYQAGLLPIYQTGSFVMASPPDSGWPASMATGSIATSQNASQAGSSDAGAGAR